ncbi:transcriptional regulator family: Fungal Specific TF [Penicillium diatomitis]|uniref:Transcriptional regulator family: Fungal Specific TF n=1 Tax=Penicillium diatomitis TaxID=2819901 RepID=A0A9W9X5Z7_9EURO|nr:transcriptional regulator family: Fungal Specific TF [Penicillium diatomitis]KAJ5485088.1 transcriptional regulator family: Fungal Specific TF [Penicillium diatomitis]
MNSSDSSSNRIGARRSRDGCKTCKIRKVKCGEEKPTCRRCSSTGRRCEYGDLQTRVLSPGFHRSITPASNYTERRAFEYYVQHASKRLAAGMNLEFWTNVAPQICRTEPAVWDAIISISALYEYPDQCLDMPLVNFQPQKKRRLTQVQQEALLWYSRSISSLQTKIVRGTADAYIALISCVLFICIEAIQGRLTEALQLYDQGVGLIVTLQQQATAGTLSTHKALSLEKILIPLFLRLGAVSLTIPTVQVSQIFALAQRNRDCPVSSLDAAGTAIHVLFAETTVLDREAFPFRSAPVRDGIVGAHLLAKQQSLQTRLDQWLQAYNHSRQRCPRAESRLLIYYVAASLYVSTCLSQREEIYDSYMAEFASIVENASQALVLEASTSPGGDDPPFTFEMGLGLPLYLTALKCRDPYLRRKALGLLRRTPPIQAFFKFVPAAFVAETCMYLEEHYNHSQLISQGSTTSSSSGVSMTHPPTHFPSKQDSATRGTPSHIPEEARICYCNIIPAPNVGSSARTGQPTDDAHGSSAPTLEIFRNRYDAESKTWRLVSERVSL